MTSFKVLIRLSQDNRTWPCMKKRPEEGLLHSSLAAKSEASEPQKQKQKTIMSKTIGRPRYVLGQALWQNLESSSIWCESAGKSRGTGRSVCPFGEAEYTGVLMTGVARVGVSGKALCLESPDGITEK